MRVSHLLSEIGVRNLTPQTTQQQTQVTKRGDVTSHRKLSLGAATARSIRRLRRSLRVPSLQAHNERVIYAEVIFQAISGAGAMSFISVFLIRLGSPNWLVGLYTSLPALVTILVVLPMGSFIQRRRSVVATASWARFIFRAVIGLFALLPFLSPSIAPYVLVASRSLIAIPGSAINVAVTTLWGKITTASRRPRMLSIRLAIHGLIGAVVGLLAGQWLDYARYPLNYQLLFASAFLAGLGSVYAFSRLRLPEAAPEETSQKQGVGLREMLLLIRSRQAFRSFAIAAFVFRMGTSLPSALFSIYRVRTLGASDSWIGILFTVQRLVSVVAYFTLARLLTRRKYRRWLWTASVGVALYPLTMALARTPEMLLIPSAIAGLFGSAMSIFLTNTLFQVSPEDQRPTFVAANSFLANVTAFVAPILGTLLADATDIRLALIVAAGLRLLGSLSFWRLGVGSER